MTDEIQSEFLPVQFFTVFTPRRYA